MSTTIVKTISTSPTQHLALNIPPRETAHIWDYHPPEVVDIALARLQEMGVRLIEWQALMHRRMHVPIFLKHYSYLVPDVHMAQASYALSDIGLPLESSSKYLTRIGGDFESLGRFHRITRDTSTALLQYIVLYPQSFSTISEDELEETHPSHTLDSRCSFIYVPTAPAAYASIMRMMLCYPRHCYTMYHLQSDLSLLIEYHMLVLPGGHVDAEEETWEVGQHTFDAVCTVQSWNLDGVWREGEEWMGDALVEILRVGTLEHLPCKPKPLRK